MLIGEPLDTINKRHIILASTSPRRKELLGRIGLHFVQAAPDYDEKSRDKSDFASPEAYVTHNGEMKALSVSADGPHIVIGSDTIVVSPDGAILEKPRDEPDACRLLRLLSGRVHRVMTGCSVVKRNGHGGETTQSFVTTTRVTFRELSDSDIAAYVGTGEPMDKAGAYGIQGIGCQLVDCIDGDYNNVVGLPLTDLCRCLEATISN